MPRFRFPLEPLLEMRRREEETRIGELAVIEHERRRLEESLRERQTELGAGRAALRAGLVGAVDVHLLRQQAAASLAVDRLARRTVLELAGLAQKADAARQRLVAAAQRRRAIEILRERRVEEWNREQDRKETAFLDELANIARARRMAEGRASAADAADLGVGPLETGSP